MTSFFKKYNKQIFAIVMIIALLVSASLAYYGARDVKDNAYTIGNVKVQLWEEVNGTTYKSKDGDPPTIEVEQGVQVAKKPYVKNSGSNDAYVYMLVGVPKDVVSSYTKNGSGDYVPGEEILQEIVYLEDDNDVKLNPDTGFTSYTSNGWTCLGLEKSDSQYNYYLFAHTTVLEAGTETNAPFTKAEVKNTNDNNRITYTIADYIGKADSRCVVRLSDVVDTDVLKSVSFEMDNSLDLKLTKGGYLKVEDYPIVIMSSGELEDYVATEAEKSFCRTALHQMSWSLTSEDNIITDTANKFFDYYSGTYNAFEIAAMFGANSPAMCVAAINEYLEGADFDVYMVMDRNGEVENALLVNLRDDTDIYDRGLYCITQDPQSQVGRNIISGSTSVTSIFGNSNNLLSVSIAPAITENTVTFSIPVRIFAVQDKKLDTSDLQTIWDNYLSEEAE